MSVSGSQVISSGLPTPTAKARASLRVLSKRLEAKVMASQGQCSGLAGG